MKTGFAVGKFAPLTTGHINFINHASTKCDKLLVLLSYDEYWRLEQTPYMKQRLTLRNRLKWLKETYYDLDHIIIDYVDETDIPPYPHGWDGFQKLVKEKLVSHFGTKQPDYVFSSETKYDNISPETRVWFAVGEYLNGHIGYSSAIKAPICNGCWNDIGRPHLCGECQWHAYENLQQDKREREEKEDEDDS